MDITIKLSLEQWNIALDILSDGSVKRAMPIINEIVRQAKEQQTAGEQPANANLMGPNGGIPLRE